MGIAISEKLNLLRKKSGKTQKEVAADLKIAPSALSSYEQGKSSPPLDLAVRIAQYYGASLDWLCDIKEQDTPYTRAKILKTLTELCENVPEAETFYEYDEGCDAFIGFTAGIRLCCRKDAWAYNFFERYDRLLALYKSGDIDADVIEAWKAKKYSELDEPIKQSPEFEQMDDDDLPF